VLLVAEASDGPLARTTVATGVVDIAPDSPWLPRLRLPLLLLAVLLLLSAVALEGRAGRARARTLLHPEGPGEATHLRLARTIPARPLFWGGAYLVDGLLVDCGPPATAREMLLFLEGRPLEGLVLTHHHEDHTGAAPLIAARRGLEPRIHPLGAPLLERGFP